MFRRSASALLCAGHQQQQILCSGSAAYATAVGGATMAKKSEARFGQPAGSPNIVLIDACRTPFVQSNTVYKELMAIDLQRHALISLMRRTGASFKEIGEVICGTVIQECKTSNIAREAALAAGFPDTIPCYTVTLACVSSNVAITDACGLLTHGNSNAVVAGGVEFMSDVPIRYNRKARAAMINFPRAKGVGKQFGLGMDILKNLLKPEAPAIAEFSTGETMGQSGDRICASFKISRREADEFALRSHTLAAKAHSDGNLSDLVPMFVPNKKDGNTITADNGVRVSTIEKLSSLKPAFIKPHGTVTAGNASFLTDGASACLLMTEDYALKNGYKPKAYIRAWDYVAQDPRDQLLLGPAYVMPRLLDRAGLTVKDVDVYEIHEAFAGQVLANMKAMDNDYFCKTYMGRNGKVGAVPMEKLNLWGGSVSIGHPFGATGVRLVAHAANRLEKEGGKVAMLAACAAGGHGHGMIIEKYP